MKKVLYSAFLALITFTLLNFIYSNVRGEAFNHPLSFRFDLPFLLSLVSRPVPLGYILILSFCLGMVFLPLLQAIPAIFRSAQIKARDRRIKELERELELVRLSEPLARPDQGSDASSLVP